MPARHDPTALRQGVLAVSVLEDIDVNVTDEGVTLPGKPAIEITWQQLSTTCARRDPLSADARRRLSILLSMSRHLADLGDQAEPYLADRISVMALPAGHVDHFGAAWTQRRLAGGALDLGFGVRDALEGVDTDLAHLRMVPLPPGLLPAVGITAASLWGPAIERSERMSALAVAMILDGQRVLRPVGGCDVPTLLVGSRLRQAIADGDGTGMRALAVPDRNRGWFDLSRVDPAYVRLAWELTDEADRGLPHPLLITRGAVSLTDPQGDLSRHAV